MLHHVLSDYVFLLEATNPVKVQKLFKLNLSIIVRVVLLKEGYNSDIVLSTVVVSAAPCESSTSGWSHYSPARVLSVLNGKPVKPLGEDFICSF